MKCSTFLSAIGIASMASGAAATVQGFDGEAYPFYYIG